VNTEEKKPQTGPNVRVATALMRSVALCLDLFVVGALLVFAPAPQWVERVERASSGGWNAWLDWALASGEWALWSLFVLFAYGVLTEAILAGTLGKRITGSRVAGRSGKRLSFPKTVIRNALKVISLVALGIPQLWAFFDVERRTIYDRIVGAMVIVSGEE
jgi:uncharacterized RDD family membrane protein YckC